MSICKPGCVTGTKPKVGYTNGCGTKKAKGGIPRLLFLVCDPTYVHPNAVADGVSPWTNLDNVKAAMCAGILNFTGPVLGDKPATSFTKKRTSSCAPETIVGGSQQVNFQDYNVTTDEDNDPTLEEFDFWDWVKNNYPYLKFGWVTCDEKMFLYDGDFTPEVSPITEQTSDDSAYFGGSVFMQTDAIIKPFFVKGLLNLLDSFTAEDCYS